MIQLVDVTVTVFTLLEVLFVWDAFSEPVPIVPTEGKDAVGAACEEVEEFNDVPPVASNSRDEVNALLEDASEFEDVSPVESGIKGAFEDSVAVLTLFKVLFA